MILVVLDADDGEDSRDVGGGIFSEKCVMFDGVVLIIYTHRKRNRIRFLLAGGCRESLRAPAFHPT
jgi:hypothetical protein